MAMATAECSVDGPKACFGARGEFEQGGAVSSGSEGGLMDVEEATERFR